MQRNAAGRTASEAKKSVLHRCARSKEAEAAKVLVRMFELTSLEEGVRTVAEEAHTRSAMQHDVSACGG